MQALVSLSIQQYRVGFHMLNTQEMTHFFNRSIFPPWLPTVCNSSLSQKYLQTGNSLQEICVALSSTFCTQKHVWQVTNIKFSSALTIKPIQWSSQISSIPMTDREPTLQHPTFTWMQIALDTGLITENPQRLCTVKSYFYSSLLLIWCIIWWQYIICWFGMNGPV